MRTTNDDHDLDALAHGAAYADLESWRKVAVAGADAGRWLQDLVTADLEPLARGVAVPSLLLSPTGGVRASFHVIPREGDAVVIQHPSQPEHVGRALARYVLSSDVSLQDETVDLALFAVPGDGADSLAHRGTSPSVLGDGTDVLARRGDQAHDVASSLGRAGRHAVSAEALERWRVIRGEPLPGVDLDEATLPWEARLDAAVARAKGCFLGQEAVAKARNLGHPRRVLRHVTVEGLIRAGEVVLRGDGEVGYATSVAPTHARTYALVRVAWHAAGDPLVLRDGRSLTDVPSPG